jgi:hypothetical protein
MTTDFWTCHLCPFYRHLHGYLLRPDALGEEKIYESRKIDPSDHDDNAAANAHAVRANAAKPFNRLIEVLLADFLYAMAGLHYKFGLVAGD